MRITQLLQEIILETPHLMHEVHRILDRKFGYVGEAVVTSDVLTLMLNIIRESFTEREGEWAYRRMPIYNPADVATNIGLVLERIQSSGRELLEVAGGIALERARSVGVAISETPPRIIFMDFQEATHLIWCRIYPFCRGNHPGDGGDI